MASIGKTTGSLEVRTLVEPHVRGSASEMIPWRLNIGCGLNPISGYVNADRVPLPGVDLVCEFARRPFPFRDDSFDEVYMSHVLEHLPDTVSTMEEIHRIARPSATVIVKVPHYKHSNAFKDPTHVRFFTEESFDYFGKDPKSYYTKARFDVMNVEKEYDWHIARYVARPFPRVLPWVERFLDNTVQGITFTLKVRK